ncbi:MAG: hypothetical protein US94_C0037G0003 [Berkelbacteria bacterium GW2011_GWB1_38_5]|uniref:Aminoglycoside phosphotransferase domain-containing protein n=1 Tax=Berkelbacteria bacterium GW2011_GWB1_38_5 TaxID=1618336 RepID=A0A0G0MHG1_9BACT|nr:MAG: hypothetical protein US94_C0037G0003 [Berkelbacteria bacterium GW2011_GWB1_38_5]
MNQNLEELLNKKVVKRIFNEKKEELGLSSNFDVMEIKRYPALAPETYTILYAILDNGQKRLFRGNASSENDRSNSIKILKFLEKDFSQGQFLIPKNHAYNSDYNLLLYENVDGEILTNELNLELADLEEKVELAAFWLAKLHSCGDNLDLPQYRFTFVEDYLIKTYPELTKNLNNRVQELNSQLSTRKKVLVHGDYQTNNIIINDNNIWVFDFNDSAIDNPMLDIASFLCQLRTMLLRFADIDDFPTLERKFLSSYKISDEERNDLKIYQKLYFIKILSSLSATLSDSDPKKKLILANIYKFYET